MKVTSFTSLILYIFLNNFCAIAQKAYTTGLNSTLEKNLEEIRDADQKIRLRMDTLVKRYGFKSPQVEPVYAEMLRIDSINTLKVEQIMQEYGYPGKKVVGDYLSTTAWLVTQHSPLAFQEKYLPLIQKAAEQGDLPKGNLALLERMGSLMDLNRLRMKRMLTNDELKWACHL